MISDNSISDDIWLQFQDLREKIQKCMWMFYRVLEITPEILTFYVLTEVDSY